MVEEIKKEMPHHHRQFQQEQPQAHQRKNSLASHRDSLSGNYFAKTFIPNVVIDKSNKRAWRSPRRTNYGLALVFFTVGVLLTNHARSVTGTPINSTLEDELLINNDHNNNNNEFTEESLASSSSLSEGKVKTFPSTLETENDAFVTADNGSRIINPLPELFTNESSSDSDKSNVKRTINQYADNGANQAIRHEQYHQINFTLPLQDFEKPPIIVKHRNVIYEVIDNGTISTNYGTISIPIISVPVTTPSSYAGLYENSTAKIIGLRVEKSAKGVSYDDAGISKILANAATTIRFFGAGFTNNTIIRFVTEGAKRGKDCDDITSTKFFHFDITEITEYSAVVKVSLPPLNEDDTKYYVCVKEEHTAMPWIHQGPDAWIVLTTYQKWLPLWAHIVILVFLLALSGLFSGLNLGLMAIDRTEIKIIMNAGSPQERRYAKQIRPLRDNGNYLLCSLLLGNVLVNASLTILLDDITSGLIAVVGSTMGIVIFGEIVPQALCSRHGLAVGAKTVWITKFFMAVTFPLSYPISVILDKVLGEEIGNVYNRERLKELIRVTDGVNDLEKQEVNIISGALELKQKTVMDVMTKLEEVYMLPIDAVLDFDTVSEIMSNGYSRIPVFEGDRRNVVSLLYTKDLAFVDPDDKMPLRAICEFYSNPCNFVFENVTLNVLFNVFKLGNKGHMAFVQRVNLSEKVDPTYEVVGLVTMEDVIEELIQEEIKDEMDVEWEDSNKRNNNKNYDAITDGAITKLKTEGTTVSPQLTLAAFQYLCTAVEEFNDTRISKTVLERMLKQNIYFHVKIKNKETMKTDPITILYERGKPADYFIMILEGKVHAEIGKEMLLFEGGPFTFFGTNSLTLSPGDGIISSSTPLSIRKISQASLPELPPQPIFIPDYTVRAVTDVTYFKISRSMYQSAKQATLLEKTYSLSDSMIEENPDEETRSNGDETDEKPKDRPITVNKPTGRGSISEVLKEDRNSFGKSRSPHHSPNENDNNNVCITLPMKNMEETGSGGRATGGLNRRRASNMAHVILYPTEERPSSEVRLHSANSFVGGGIVDNDEKCKL